MSAPAFSLDLIPRPQPDSFVPLYVQIADEITRAIRAKGASAIGKILPSEAEWMNHLGVSRPTVRQAMARLCHQGLITRHKGRGTFVTPAVLDHDIGKVFEDEIRASNRGFSFKLLRWEQVPLSEELASIFRCEVSAMGYRLVRVRLVDGKIVGLEERYLPAVIGDRISAREMKTESILELLRNLTGQRQAQMQMVVSMEAASEEEAGLLAVKRGTPLMVRKTTCYFDPERPLLHGITKFIAKNYQFRFKLKLDL